MADKACPCLPPSVPFLPSGLPRFLPSSLSSFLATFIPAIHSYIYSVHPSSLNYYFLASSFPSPLTTVLFIYNSEDPGMKIRDRSSVRVWSGVGRDECISICACSGVCIICMHVFLCMCSIHVCLDGCVCVAYMSVLMDVYVHTCLS